MLVFKTSAFSQTLPPLRMCIIKCGESGIRTHGTRKRTHAFQACSLNHSDTSPISHNSSVQGPIWVSHLGPVAQRQRPLRPFFTSHRRNSRSRRVRLWFSGNVRHHRASNDSEVLGGEGGIRTHGTREGTPVFETGPIDHSGTSPLFKTHLHPNQPPACILEKRNVTDPPIPARELLRHTTHRG